jgi:hypothetical protein
MSSLAVVRASHGRCAPPLHSFCCLYAMSVNLQIRQVGPQLRTVTTGRRPPRAAPPPGGPPACPASEGAIGVGAGADHREHPGTIVCIRATVQGTQEERGASVDASPTEGGGRAAVASRGRDGRVAGGVGAHRPHRHPRGRRHLGLGLHHDGAGPGRVRGARRHRVDLRSTGLCRGGARPARRRRPRYRRRRRRPGLHGHGRRGPQRRPPRRGRLRALRGRRRPVGPQGPAARPAAAPASRRRPRRGRDLWQRRVHHLRRGPAARPAHRLGGRPAHPSRQDQDR